MSKTNPVLPNSDASPLGFRAAWAFFGPTDGPFVAQLAYFVRPDGLTFLAVEAVVVGTLAFGAGWLARRGSSRSATGRRPPSSERLAPVLRSDC